MQKAIIGKKIGMTQIFDESGKVIPVTVVEAGPCVVVQKKTVENDGYAAVQVGYGDVKVQRMNKPMKGHFEKADVAAKKTLKEFRLEGCDALNVGDVIKADIIILSKHDCTLKRYFRFTRFVFPVVLRRCAEIVGYLLLCLVCIFTQIP